MKKRWPVLILTLTFMLSIAATAMAAPAPAGSQAAVNSAQRVAADQEFDDFFQELFEGYAVDVSPEQKQELESLFAQIMDLEADENYVEAYQQWEQFYGLSDPLWENAVYEYPEFNEFVAGSLPEDISDADRSELERLFNEAVALEESGDMDAAEQVWLEFDDLLVSCWGVEDQEGWEEDCWAEEGEYPAFEDYYGEEYLDDLSLTDAERAEMKVLYDEAVALEESGDWEASEEKWQALWDLEAVHYDEYWANYEYPSFDEFMADYDGDFSPRALEQMRTLYDEAVVLEKSGEWEAAADKWDALYYIMDRFGAFDEYEDIAA